MRRALWLVAGIACWSLQAYAQAPAPVAAELGDLAAALRDYVTELEAAVPELQQRLRAEDGAARQFESYLRRMRADAAVQRTVLALGNVRPPQLAQAKRNWSGWAAVAHERLAQAVEWGETATRLRQEEEERWALLGEEPAAGEFATALGETYAEAQTLRGRKLALLARAEALAQRGAKDAEKARQLCAAIAEAIARTAERERSRFLLTRVQLAAPAAMIAETRADVQLVLAPLFALLPGDWRGHLTELMRANSVAVLTALAVLVGLGWWGRRLRRSLRALVRRLAAARIGVGTLRRFFLALAVAFDRSLLLALLAALALGLRALLGPNAPAWSQPLLGLILATLGWWLTYTLAGAACDPERPERWLGQWDEAAAMMLRRSLQRLALWMWGATVLALLVRRGGLTAPPLMLAFVAAELLALRSVHRMLREDRLRAAGMAPVMLAPVRRWRLILRAALLLMVGLCGFGFVNLAWYLGWSLLKSTVLLAGALLMWWLGGETLRQYSADLPGQLQRSLSRLWSSALAVAAVLAFPVVWEVDEALRRALAALLDFGVAVGDRRITVLRIALAVACLAGGWFAGRLLGAILERRVFPRTLLDTGLRTAIVTSLNYVLVAAGVLVAVRTLGFDLTNLAIMAGALGVGIGFGLQAVVSNFVSGLIILFERPYKLGDILEHEGAFGTVRRIRTRSTVLRTFDESEIVLPNAELLAHKITNWTLTDNRSRATIKLGVAYGSDVTAVRDTLLRLAQEHPRVLDEPRVYFTKFGDSALEFCLMVWVDIRERPQVISDLHFAIDAAFRQLGIAIPYPQRDVHLYTHGREDS